MNRFVFGALVALVAACASSGVAQAAGRDCRAVSADNPMVSGTTYGLAKCHARGARYFTRAFLGEGARGYARRTSSDPMVWSDGRWRSSLMSGYAQTYNDGYDRRFRRGGAAVQARHMVRVVVTRAMPIETIETKAEKPRRARLINMRTRGDAERYLENSSKFSGHRCNGILVLTWKAGGARSRCHESTSRIRTAD